MANHRLRNVGFKAWTLDCIVLHNHVLCMHGQWRATERCVVRVDTQHHVVICMF